MPKKSAAVLLGLAVVLVHCMLLAWLCVPSCRKTEMQEIPPAESVSEVTPAPDFPATEPAALVPPASTPQSTVPLPVPAAVATMPLQEKYSGRFFDYSRIPQLPQTIQNAVKDCTEGIAVDLKSRRVCWEKNSRSPKSMASITKMMTSYLVVEKIRKSGGSVTMDTPVKVTANAEKIGGRQLWISTRETFTIQELLKGTLVHSANDCAYLLAEFLGGTEQAFVMEMNKTAAEMGCTTMKFYNSYGLTEKALNVENMASPAELAYLANILLDIPEITKWTCVRTEYLRENDQEFLKRNKGVPTMLSSSNSLLGRCPGVNGMKTGYTDKSGFCIVATCERNARQCVVVLMGCPKAKTRDNIAKALFDWIYAGIEE